MNTQIFDTSEKQRVPSWTDRILFSGNVSQETYDRKEILMSDHRPVCSLFTVELEFIDKAKRSKIKKELRLLAESKSSPRTPRNEVPPKPFSTMNRNQGKLIDFEDRHPMSDSDEDYFESFESLSVTNKGSLI